MSGRKAALGVVAVLVVAAAFLAGSLSSREDDDAGTSGEASCVDMRKAWTAVVTDFDAAQAAQRRYEGAGCSELCGDLVEDEDTPERETRCGDDAIISKGTDATITTVATPTTAREEQAAPPSTAPSMPGAIPGYEPAGPPVRMTLRLFDDKPKVIDEFPVTMNGCRQGLSTTRWRSLGGDVEAAVTSYPADPSSNEPDLDDIRDATIGRAGLVRTEHQCDQPVFTSRDPSSGIVDVVIEYQAWTASA